MYAIDKDICKGAGAKVQCGSAATSGSRHARVNTLFDGFELKEYDAEKAKMPAKQKARP